MSRIGHLSKNLEGYGFEITDHGTVKNLATLKEYRVTVSEKVVDQATLDKIQGELLQMLESVKEQPFHTAEFHKDKIVTYKDKASYESKTGLNPVIKETYKVAYQTLFGQLKANPSIEKARALGEEALKLSETIQKTLLNYHLARARRKKTESIEETLDSLYQQYQTKLVALAKLQRENREVKEIEYAIAKVTDAEQSYTLSTHSSSIMHYRCLQVLAVRERQKIEEGKGPTVTEIARFLKPLPKQGVLSLAEAKKEYKKTLSWGKDYLDQALSQPENWLKKREVGIRYSKDGNAHVTVTEVEPHGHTPSGLREKGEHAVNMQKTTTYVLDDGGNPVNERVGWRIGQLPTVTAAKEAIEKMELNEGDTYFDNTLLTPMLVWKPDRKLLREHKKNLEAALKDKGVESMHSNFGVNEGAVGELLGLKLGWHESLTYNNLWVEKFNNALLNWFDDMNDQKKALLPAVVQLGQELERIWANNDYATAHVGNNQVKFPGIARALATLLGMTCNTHCKSAKDRASVVEAYANELLLEVEMNLLDSNGKAEYSVEDAKKALGGDAGLLMQKEMRLTKNAPQTLGISTNMPLEKAEGFPQLSEPSIYDEISPEEQQRLLRNRRMGMRISDLVTQENTGVAGNKLLGVTPLKRFYSGFDPNYIIERLTNGAERDELEALLGLGQVDEKTRESILDKLLSTDKVRTWRNTLKRLEEIKFQSHRPQCRVKS